MITIIIYIIVLLLLLSTILCIPGNKHIAYGDKKGPGLKQVLDVSCSEGDLRLALQISKNVIISKDKSIEASILHIQSAINFIMFADIEKAIDLHLRAKVANATIIPPLAELNLKGNKCGGLGDIFYVGAVLIKQFVDSRDKDIIEKNRIRLEGLTTMITLTSDSGLHSAAESHSSEALKINPNDTSILIRSAVLTPAVYENMKHLKTTRSLLSGRIETLLLPEITLSLETLDEFTLSPTFYFVYQGYNDRKLLSDLNAVYAKANPLLSQITLIKDKVLPLTIEGADSKLSRKIRVGFVSSHFRRHSVCKLFCGIITGLDSDVFDVYVFSSLSESKEDERSRELINVLNHRYVRLGMTTVNNRDEVTGRRIDILVYLDVGMIASTPIWAASRLAPIQITTWGHPVTTGMLSMDYFVSSSLYHNYHNHTILQDSFSEQLVQLDALGFYFYRPILSFQMLSTKEGEGKITVDNRNPQEDYLFASRPESFYTGLQEKLKENNESKSTSDLYDLINEKILGAKIVLCPQHLPKFHPHFDYILNRVLAQVPNCIVVVIGDENKDQWRRTIDQRWRRNIGAYNMQRVMWIGSLNPTEYLILLAVGDLMLDPYPFGGGVTILESISVCTPVITSPSLQTVPGLAAGMLQSMNLAKLDLIIASDQDDYVDKATLLLGAKEQDVDKELNRLRRKMCENGHLLFNNTKSIDEWGRFLKNTALLQVQST